MNDKINEIRKVIKDLEKENISVLDLQIVYEIDCQLNKQITDEEYNLLYNMVEWAYLKLDSVALDSIVACGIENLDRLNDDDFDFREECCWY